MSSAMCRLLAMCLAIATLVPSSLHLQAQSKTTDWPQFRGPTRQGISSDTEVPTTWNSTKNLIWKTGLPGPGTSSPIVVGARVYVTSFLGFGVPGQRGDMDRLLYRLACFWTKDGSQLWAVDIEPDLPEQVPIREAHGYASSTPASDGKMIFTFFGKSGVYAFDQYGRRLWRTKVGSKTHIWGSAASPVLFKDFVIVNASVESQSLVALEKKTGKVVWRTKGIIDAWNTPLLVTSAEGRRDLVIAVRGKLLGFDPTTGQQIWTCSTDFNSYMVPSIAAESGIVYCIGGRAGGGLAVRSGGEGDVTETHRLWTMRKGSNVASPIVHEGHLYWMHENMGIAYCADAATGKIVYEQRLTGVDQVYASPVLAGGKLYYLTRTGQTFLIAAKPDFQLLGKNKLSDSGFFNASPAIANGRLFIRSEQVLYCLGKD